MYWRPVNHTILCTLSKSLKSIFIIILPTKTKIINGLYGYIVNEERFFLQDCDHSFHFRFDFEPLFPTILGEINVK